MPRGQYARDRATLEVDQATALAFDFDKELVKILPALKIFAHYLTKDPVSAEDAVSDAMIKILQARMHFIPGTNFKAWTFMILRNEWLSKRRKNWRMVSTDPQSIELDQISEESALWRLHLQDAQEHINKLSPEFQEVINLVCIQGLSYETVSTLLEVPAGTIKSRVGRARDALYKSLGGVEGLKDSCERPRNNTGAQTIHRRRRRDFHPGQGKYFGARYKN